MDKPLLSVCCIAYNQKQYIKNCMDAVLAQQTTFPFEFLIHDDCSTDGTKEIIASYAEKYPDIIKPMFEEQNQYSNGNDVRIHFYNYERAEGKYIAYLDGDDYWTDPLKLQKQVDFMEANQEYSVCFHRCTRHDIENDVYSEDETGSLFVDGASFVDITVDDFFKRWITQPLSMVFRKDVLPMDIWKQYKYYRDEQEIYYLLKHGKGGIFSFIGGIYNLNENGIWAKVSKKEACEHGLRMAQELYDVNRDNSTKVNLENVLQWNINNHNIVESSKLVLSWRLFVLNRRVPRFIKNLLM